MRKVLQNALEQFIGSAVCPGPQSPKERLDARSAVWPALVLENPSEHLAKDLRGKGFGHLHRFAVLPSFKSPRCLLPLGDRERMLQGFQIYTAYARGAQAAKAAAIRFIKAGWNGWGCSRVLIASRERLSLEKLVTEVTGEPAPAFALSVGSPWRYRKLTLQAMASSGTILGYIKLPLSEPATNRIRHEATVLEMLSKLPTVRPHIPRVLHAGPWGNGYLLFQSPVVGEPGPCTFSGVHEAFLEKLWGAEHFDKPGHALCEEVGARWRKAEPSLSPGWRALGEAALAKARRNLEGAMVACGVAHGDFTPWNTRLADGQLSLFDWESATLGSPNLFDIFCFHVKVGCLLGKPGARTRLQAMRSEEKACFLLYILNFVSQSLSERGQDEEERDAEARRFRLGLEYFHGLLSEELSR